MTRENIILNFFMSLQKHYNYSIIHHIEDIFEVTNDIDLVVDCDKKELHTYIANYCLANKLYFIRHTIDLGAVRYNLLHFNENEIVKVELDITYSNNNILGIDIQSVLKKRQSVSITDKSLNKLNPEDEYLIYLRKKAFKKSGIDIHFNYFQTLLPQLKKEEINKQYLKQFRYFNSLSFRFKFYIQKALLLYYRILEKPCKTICFLGPDGSGKTTIIEGVRTNNPYVNFQYYHLKPKKKKTESNQVETNPHKKNNYSSVLSILKLVYFLFEYNFNWIKNIIPKKITPVLIVFDRYFDDIIADPKRYRYGAPEFVVRVFRKFIPSPDTTFVLDAPAEVVLSRKKEVSQISLEAQLEKYRALGNRKNYFIIKVNRPINEIVQDVIKIIIKQ